MLPAVRMRSVGRVSFGRGVALQQELVERLRADGGSGPDTLLLCEHEPVYTVGIRRAPYPPEEERRLRALGADFCRSDRGGLITFHGPGQLLCYPVLHLRRFRPSVRWYVRQLERTVISTCQMFGLRASTSADTGVWVEDRKICAIGIHCGRYVTSHGLALNCNTDLAWFQHIVPCGLVGKGVTSLSRELGRDVSVEEATPRLLEAFAEHFQCTVIHESP